jgi:hypothetical protein
MSKRKPKDKNKQNKKEKEKLHWSSKNGPEAGKIEKELGDLEIV